MNNHQKQIHEYCTALKLTWMQEHYETLHQQALKKKTGSLKYLAELLRGEAQTRHERAIERRIKAARFPLITHILEFKSHKNPLISALCKAC